MKIASTYTSLSVAAIIASHTNFSRPEPRTLTGLSTYLFWRSE